MYPQPLEITGLAGSVGFGGMNRYADVSQVTDLINLNLVYKAAYRNACAAQGLLDGFGELKPDTPEYAPGGGGQYDLPNLNEAIRQFQIVGMGRNESWADARVDPNGQTWRSLLGTLSSGHIAPNSLPAPTGRARGIHNGFSIFSQGDFRELLGHRWDSNRDDIVNEYDAWAHLDEKGCCLTVITMAATKLGKPQSCWPKGLLPKDLSPSDVNKIALNNQGYSEFGGLITTRVPVLLGMKANRYGSNYKDPLPLPVAGFIDGILNAGHAVAAHVDYSGSSRGDHWVLITNKVQSGLKAYEAIDPSGGYVMGFSKNSNARELAFEKTTLARDAKIKAIQEANKTAKKKAKVPEPYSFKVGHLWGMAAPNASLSRKEKQNKYRLVGLITLMRTD